ncbi:MAG: hypothetical protein IJZ95_05685 [Oscillospiraceae bacterium]|nr:hypothetical protein [Oscillospiraceae bacterium]
MQEYFDYVQKGMRILHPLLAGFVGNEMHRQYKNKWWDMVLYTLNDHEYELPSGGEYNDLVDSLDIANCVRLVQRQWKDLFRYSLDREAQTLANELMGIRNIVAHIGQQDIEQLDAERYLDTMARLCEKIDEDGAQEIRELYNALRFSEDDSDDDSSLSGPMPLEETLVDEVDMREGAVEDLMTLIRTNKIYKTKITKKITFAGKTELYPVYRVRIDALYYNDQNDRISTWISSYRAEHGASALSTLGSDEYNDVIENFIFESNPESIRRTQKNIALVGQQQPGVILADGRIVDGNRRVTCLRRIQRDSGETQFFETVIMNVDMNRDRKQIKLLELAIQHGEEKKVDYDLIDYAVGTYRDVVVTGLLTAEEYAAGANESVSDVKKRIETAALISKFLDYVKLPGQYHVARDLQVYSMFIELLPMLSKCSAEDKQRLMQLAFNNVLLKACPDQRKFIRDIKKLVNDEGAADFLAEQDTIGKHISENFSSLTPENKADLDKFASDNAELADDMNASIERSLLRMRTKNLVNKPSENVAKCKNLLSDIDPRLFGKLDEDEKRDLVAELEDLSRMAEGFRKMLTESE